MTTLARIVTLAAALALAPLPAVSQSPAAEEAAMLVADDVRLMADESLVASGNVEVLFEGRRLQASKITYDSENDRLLIEGPITVREPDGTVTLADQADLDSEMRNGILTGARVVFDSQVQMAANALTRVEGRYSRLTKATVTSCRICETGRPPIWQIRAGRIVHDEQERQLYFDNAQLRVFDVPVAYLPRLRLPDPTLERARGFLTPVFQNSSLLGFGLKIPYFIPIGDHKDVTLTPYIAESTRTLEFRYRQAFRNGDISVIGAVSNDDIHEDEWRGYLFGSGRFDLARDFDLTFDLKVASDDDYLFDYDYDSEKRLRSEIAVERARRDEYIRGALTYVHTQQSSETQSLIPSIIASSEYERRFYPAAIGGELRLGAELHSHYRSSDLSIDGTDFDSWADGRDVTRLTGSADWRRNWTLPGGVLAEFQTGLVMDAFHVAQAGPLTDTEAVQLSPSSSLKLRWPLLKRTGSGASHLLEPVAQVSWVGGSNPAVPNDESARVEFDEGNLFSLSRFSAPDRRERGVNAAYGLQWTRFAPKGWETTLAVGQVYRDEIETEPTGLPSFTESSGLQSNFSDLLVAGQIKTANGLTFTGRGLFDDAFDTTKAEARASWQTAVMDLGATYVWLQSDPAEERDETYSEWSFDGSYRFARHWRASADLRYDVARDFRVESGLGLTYTNECVLVAVRASRRYTNSSNVSPTTNISFTIGLRGFTMKTADKSYVRTCKN